MLKITKILMIFLTILLFTGACEAALPVGDDAEVAAGQVMITNVTVDPDILMMDDTATITVTIQNNGEDPVPISTANLYSDDLRVVNDKTYSAVGTIGAGNTNSFTYTVEANAKDGIYYLWFYLDFRDAGSLKYNIPITIESTPLLISVVDAPEVFQTGAEQGVTVLVANPRENDVNGVKVIPSGEGIESVQSVGFIGNLQPDSSKQVLFDITATNPTDLTFTTLYRNGINEHSAETTIPIETGEGKTSATLIANNIEITGGAGSYTLTGDINNAGLDEAYSIVATVGDPAKPTDPYKSYIVGSLESDDFSSFELTFSSKVNSVPLLITYKDQYGNDYSTEVTLNLNEIMGGAGFDGSSSGTGGTMIGPGGAPDGAPAAGGRGGPGGMMGFGSGMSSIPVVEIGIGIGILIVAVVGVHFIRRSRLKKQQKKQIEEHPYQ